MVPPDPVTYGLQLDSCIAKAARKAGFTTRYDESKPEQGPYGSPPIAALLLRKSSANGIHGSKIVPSSASLFEKSTLMTRSLDLRAGGDHFP
jgi:hypothetical protein